MGIDVVSFLHILQNGVEIGWHALLLQFVEAALCSHLRTCRNENLQFGVREYGGADVTAIHHDALVFAHLLLLSHQRLSYERNGCHRTYVVGNLKRADFLLYQFAVEIAVWATGGSVKLERDLDIRHLGFQLLHLHLAILLKEVVAQGVEGYRTVHGACIHIHITYLLGKILCHGTLSAGRVTVYCDCNLLHYL